MIFNNLTVLKDPQPSLRYGKQALLFSPMTRNFVGTGRGEMVKGFHSRNRLFSPVTRETQRGLIVSASFIVSELNFTGGRIPFKKPFIFPCNRGNTKGSYHRLTSASLIVNELNFTDGR